MTLRFSDFATRQIPSRSALNLQATGGTERLTSGEKKKKKTEVMTEHSSKFKGGEK